MNIFLRASILGLIVLSVGVTTACSGGGSGASGNVAGAAGFAANGEYEGLQTFITNIRVVDLNANTPPISGDCRGDIRITIDDSASNVILGSGDCLLPANSARYTIRGGFVSDVNVEGEITIVFSGVTHVLPFDGSVIGDRFDGSFSGRTPQTSRLVIDWDGGWNADRI